jgi:hypothetical protein
MFYYKNKILNITTHKIIKDIRLFKSLKIILNQKHSFLEEKRIFIKKNTVFEEKQKNFLKKTSFLII